MPGLDDSMCPASSQRADHELHLGVAASAIESKHHGAASADAASDDVPEGGPKSFDAELPLKNGEGRADAGASLQVAQPEAVVLTTPSRPEETLRRWALEFPESPHLVQHADPLEGLWSITYILSQRYTRGGGAASLDKYIELQQELCGLCPMAHPLRARVLRAFGNSSFTRYKMSGNLQDLETDVLCQREAVSLCAPLHPDHALCIVDLAEALHIRYEHTTSVEDLDEAARLHQEALALCPEGSQMRYDCLAMCAAVAQNHFSRFGDTENLEEAIRIYDEILRWAACSGHARYTALNNLGEALRMRVSHTGDLDDLAKTIHLQREALTLARALRIPSSMSLSNLALGLCARYHRLSRIEDLEEAISAFRQGLEQLDGRPLDRALMLSNLAEVLRIRFMELGSVENLDEAVICMRQAVQLCPPAHVQRATIVGNLALVVHTRCTHAHGSHDDLEESIGWHRETLELRDPGDPQRALSLNNLAEQLRTRFGRSRDRSDLEESICLEIEGLSLVSSDSWFRSHLLINLALAYHARFDEYRDVQDLDLAIPYLLEAIDLSAEDHLMHAICLENLSEVYRARFHVLGDADDATQALSLRLDALPLLPPGHAARSSCLLIIARAYSDPLMPCYNATSALKHLSESITDDHRSPHLRLTSALSMLDDLEESQKVAADARSQLLDVYVNLIHLLPRVADFGLEVRSRLRALEHAESVAIDAAAHALILSKPETALEVLEEGRGVFWTQALQLRTTFDDLPAGLRDDLALLSRQLETDSHSRSDATSSNEDIDRDAARRRRLSEKFNGLVNDVRAMPGFERFMLPDDFRSVSAAAENGPVVILLCGKVSCDALLVPAPGVTARVPLLNVTQGLLTELAAAMTVQNQRSRHLWDERAMTKVVPDHLSQQIPEDTYLAKLWTLVVKPILDALQLSPSSGRDRPRLWWCPTGQFVFLPIHAAGIYGPGGSCCSDYVVSSYTPTLSALSTARRGLRPISRGKIKALLAAVPEPHTGSLLPNTLTEIEEVRAVLPAQTLLPTSSGLESSPDISTDVTVAEMLQALPGATVLHLACHSWQDPRDSLASGFLLHDDTLTIAHLMQLVLPHAFLAFLSACETAKGDRGQPDQMVHLAATMLFAGFKSVVGTMWSMSDIRELQSRPC